MNKLSWFILAVFFLGVVGQLFAYSVRDRAISERDAARQEVRVIAALYNGLLIGRGCEVPE